MSTRTAALVVSLAVAPPALPAAPTAPLPLPLREHAARTGRQALDAPPAADVTLAARILFHPPARPLRSRWDSARLALRLDPASGRHVALEVTSDGRAWIDLVDGLGLPLPKAAPLASLPGAAPSAPVEVPIRLTTAGALVRATVGEGPSARVLEALDLEPRAGSAAIEAQVYTAAPVVWRSAALEPGASDSPLERVDVEAGLTSGGLVAGTGAEGRARSLRGRDRADSVASSWTGGPAAAPPAAPCTPSAPSDLWSPLRARLIVRLRNASSVPRRLAVRLEIAGLAADGPDTVHEADAAGLEPGGTATVVVPLARARPGPARLRLLVLDEGRVVNAPGGALGRVVYHEPLELVPEATVVHPDEPLRLHVRSRSGGDLEATWLHADVRHVGARPEDGPIRRVRLPLGPGGTTSVPVSLVKKLHAPSWYDLVVSAPSGGRLGTARFGVFPRREPERLEPIREATVRPDGVVLVNDRPFFPLDLIHGSRAWLSSVVPLPPGETIDRLLLDVKAHGFNVAGEGGSPAQVDAHWTRENLYTIDRRLGRGMRAEAGSPARRYDRASIASDVARRRLPDGRFHPGWLGGGLADEPDLALVYGYAGAEEVNEGLRILDGLLPGRLTHAELSNDAVHAASQLAPLDAYVIGFAHAPAEVALLADAAARAARGRTSPASPWGTGIQLFPYDDPQRLVYAPGPLEVRAAVYMNVVHGAKGLEFYPYHQGEFVWQRSPLVWSLFKGLPQEIAVLAGRIAFCPAAARDVTWSSDGGLPGDLHATARTSRGRTWIVAVNASPSETIVARFEVPGMRGGRRARVHFEDRSIRTREGRFEDRLGPFEARLYEVEPD